MALRMTEQKNSVLMNTVPVSNLRHNSLSVKNDGNMEARVIDGGASDTFRSSRIVYMLSLALFPAIDSNLPNDAEECIRNKMLPTSWAPVRTLRFPQ